MLSLILKSFAVPLLFDVGTESRVTRYTEISVHRRCMKDLLILGEIHLVILTKYFKDQWYLVSVFAPFSYTLNG